MGFLFRLFVYFKRTSTLFGDLHSFPVFFVFGIICNFLNSQFLKSTGRCSFVLTLTFIYLQSKTRDLLILETMSKSRDFCKNIVFIRNITWFWIYQRFSWYESILKMKLIWWLNLINGFLNFKIVLKWNIEIIIIVTIFLRIITRETNVISYI